MPDLRGARELCLGLSSSMNYILSNDSTARAGNSGNPLTIQRTFVCNIRLRLGVRFSVCINRAWNSYKYCVQRDPDEISALHTYIAYARFRPSQHYHMSWTEENLESRHIRDWKDQIPSPSDIQTLQYSSLQWSLFPYQHLLEMREDLVKYVSPPSFVYFHMCRKTRRMPYFAARNVICHQLWWFL